MLRRTGLKLNLAINLSLFRLAIADMLSHMGSLGCAARTYLLVAYGTSDNVILHVSLFTSTLLNRADPCFYSNPIDQDAHNTDAALDATDESDLRLSFSKYYIYS